MRGNRLRLERHFFVWNWASLVAGLIVPRVPIAVCSRIKELDPVQVNKVPVILPARFLVLPGLSALAAFEINSAAFV